MSAFKAANPDAVFEDFIRWHSRGDWESNVTEASGALGGEKHDDWPPKGRLSKRMSEHGNFWRKLWNDAPALPAYDQKPLFDPNLEGEKVIFSLHGVHPSSHPLCDFLNIGYCLQTAVLELEGPHQVCGLSPVS